MGGVMQYGDIFVEVRQRVCAFKYWRKFWKNRGQNNYPYGRVDESEYLDDAYRFLFTTASRDFIEFCAHMEFADFDEYCGWLGINQKDLV